MSELGILEGDELDADTIVIKNFFLGINSLVLFLQYFGVILVDDIIDLGYWERVFSWVKLFTVSFNFDPNPVALLSLLIAIIVFPISIIAMLKYFLTRPPIDPEFGKKEKTIIKIVTIILLLTLISAVILIFFNESNVATMSIIVFVYSSLGLVFYLCKKGIIKKSLSIISLRAILLLCYVPIASVMMSTILIHLNNAKESPGIKTEEDDRKFKDVDADENFESFIFSITALPALLFYMMCFELQILLVSRDINAGWITKGYLTCIFLTEEQKQFIQGHIQTVVRVEVWYISLFLIIERLLISIVGGFKSIGTTDLEDLSLEGIKEFYSDYFYASTDEYYDKEFATLFYDYYAHDFVRIKQKNENIAFLVSILLAVVLSVSVVLFSICKPFKTKRLNIVEIAPRESHVAILLISIVFFKPKIKEVDLDDIFDVEIYYYDDDGPYFNVSITNQDLFKATVAEDVDKLQQVLLFLVSVPMIIFWIVILDPYKLYIALKNQKDSIVSTLYEAKVKMKWFDVESGTDVLSMRYSNKSALVTKTEWKSLNNKQKLLVISAIDESQETIEQYQGITFHFHTFNAVVARYGAAALQEIKNLDLSSANLSNNDLKLIGETGLLAMLPNVTSLDISTNNNISVKGLDSILDTILETSGIKHLNLSDCQFRAKYAEKIARFITNSTTLESLNLGLNRLMTNGAEVIVDAARKSKTLVSLNLNHNYIEEVTDKVFNSQVTHLSLVDNCMTDEVVIDFISRIKGDNIKEINLWAQLSSEFLEHLDENGEIKTSEGSMQRFHQRNRFMGMKKPPGLVINEMLKVYETIPDISFSSTKRNKNSVKFNQAFTRRIKINEGNELSLENLRNCVDFEKNFKFDEGGITGVTEALLEQLQEGKCCYLTAALLNLSDDQKAQVPDFINDADAEGTTILELVLLNGVSHVSHCAEILVNFGFDVQQKGCDASKTLLEIALEHKHDDVVEWAKRI